MAYYATSTLVPADEVLFDVHGPGDLIAGEPAESEELAKTWVELLSQREAEIQGALDAGDTARAEAIWQEVEEEARRQAPAATSEQDTDESAMHSREEVTMIDWLTEVEGAEYGYLTESGMEGGTLVVRSAAGDTSLPPYGGRFEVLVEVADRDDAVDQALEYEAQKRLSRAPTVRVTTIQPNGSCDECGEHDHSSPYVQVREYRSHGSSEAKYCGRCEPKIMAELERRHAAVEITLIDSRA